VPAQSSHLIPDSTQQIRQSPRGREGRVR
jgi:hypothetical protein